MATTTVIQSKQRHVFSRRFLELVIPKNISPPTPNFCDTQNLAMYFYSELSEISEIIPDSLYLSGSSPVTSDNLKALGVTAVVCALSEYEERRLLADRRIPDSVKLLHVRITDAESSDISTHFDRAGEFIDQEINDGGRVLVHCAAGISRSTSLVLAYLVRYRNYDLRNAFNLVKSSRKVVRPNNGFFQHLINYERSIHGDEREPSVKMVKQNEEDTAFIPDIVMEHAKRVSMQDWRHLG